MANKKRILKVLFCVLIVFGIGLIALGIVMPILIQQSIDAAIDDLWMKKDSFSSWGVLPGKIGIKMTRSFIFYNVTNPDEILLGETPKLVELPEYPTQEYSKWFDWSYTDANGVNSSVSFT